MHAGYCSLSPLRPCGMLADSEAMSAGPGGCLIPCGVPHSFRWHRRQVLNPETVHPEQVPQFHIAAGNATSGPALGRCLRLHAVCLRRVLSVPLAFSKSRPKSSLSSSIKAAC